MVLMVVKSVLVWNHVHQLVSVFASIVSAIVIGRAAAAHGNPTDIVGPAVRVHMPAFLSNLVRSV
eukprot:2037834-Amphidinium_carterae.1